MSAFIRCDNGDCGKTFTVNDRHIALNVEGVPDMPSAEVDGEFQTFTIIDSGFVASTHFCSMACLASWAIAQHLEEAT